MENLYKMHWLIFASLTSLICSLVSAAPPNQDFIPQDVGQNNLLDKPVISDDKETTIVAEASIKDNNALSGETVTENQTTKLQNSSESHLSTLKSSRSEESSDIVEEMPTKREDTQPPTEIHSQTETYTTSQEQISRQSLNQTSIEQQEASSETPSVSGEATESTTKIPTTPPTTIKPKPSKPKPSRTTTLKPLAAESPVTPAITARPTSVTAKPTKPTSTQRYPCRCGEGTCSCCTGIVLENFNVPLRSRACANVTYEPDDFAFNFKLAYNNIILYNRRMSAKNPRPVCIPINRYFGVKMCAKLSNVYMSGRNMHACLDFEGFFSDETAFKYSFNCFRVGSQGVAIVRPEDGGGLPPPPDEEEQTDEDYDDSARHIYYVDDEDYTTAGEWKGEVDITAN